MIYKNVKIGKNSKIERFVIIGKPARGRKNGQDTTIIGDNAIIRSHTVIYAGNIIGNNLETGHGVLIRESNKIGDNVSVGSHSVIEFNTVIEDCVRIHSGAFIPEYSILKRGCWIGPSVVLTNAKYPKSRYTKKYLKGCIIEENAKVGANTTVLPGIRIGKNSLIGAGSVVTKDVPDNTVVAGNPAKKLKNIDEIKESGNRVY
ncbi:MAG: acyltransferase [Candidatus Woesearchaeota archaeon]